MADNNDVDDWNNGYRGNVVYEANGAHPTILGPDGEPLRITRRNPIGFDLSRRIKTQS